MEFIGRATNIARDMMTGKFNITFEMSESVDQEQIETTLQEDKLRIKATKYRERRSLDANAYAWVLIHKIGAEMGMPAEDVYRRYVSMYGLCEVVPIRVDAIDTWCEVWRSKGIGWIAEDAGKCKNYDNYHNIKCFYGSSVYDTKQMSVLINAIVEDAKQLRVETIPDSEIERLVDTWQGKA